MEDSVARDCNFHVWLEILSWVRHNKNVIRKYIISDIMAMLSTCRELAVYRHSDDLWCMICQEFEDYEMLKSRRSAENLGWSDAHLFNLSWKDIYIRRIKNLFREEELCVGDPEHPEYKISIYIYGDGRCFMSRTLMSLEMPEHNPALLIPIRQYRLTNNITLGSIQDYEIIDVHAANMTILLLCHDGKVLEMIFTPSWMQEYSRHMQPVLVEFIELIGTSDKIRIIRTLASTNIAISEQGKVFVWTIIQHPQTMEIIRTTPLHIKQLDGVMENIYDACDDHDLSITRILWRSKTTRDPISGVQLYEDQSLDLDNNQIMMLIMENYFSEDVIDDLSQSIVDAE